jgi:hypothetical protein
MAPPYYYKLGQLKWTSKPKSAEYSSLPSSSAAFKDRTSSEQDSDDGLLEKGGSDAREGYGPQQSIWRNRRFLAAHGVLFAVYTLILILVSNRNATTARYYGMPFCKFANESGS